jgi:predicted acyltransferase
VTASVAQPVQPPKVYRLRAMTGGLSQPWPDAALAGVLQRITACYLFASLVYCCVSSPRGIAAVSAALLLGYWGLLAWASFRDMKL